MIDAQRNFENHFYELRKERENTYVEFQIRKNRKWHSFFYFLRFLFTGDD